MNMQLKWVSAAVVVVSGLTLSSANAAPLAIFDFGPAGSVSTSVTYEELSGTPTLVQAGGSIDEDGATGIAFTDAGGTVRAAGSALAFDSGINDSPANTVLFTFDSTGYKDFVIRFDGRSTSAGSPTVALDYRLGTSGGFTSIETINLSLNSAYTVESTNLSSINSIEDFGTVQLRYTFAAGSGTGTAQMDNLQLTGVAVPEPASLALVGLGGLLALRRRRR
jgi:hypothetical protein